MPPLLLLLLLSVAFAVSKVVAPSSLSVSVAGKLLLSLLPVAWLFARREVARVAAVRRSKPSPRRCRTRRRPPARARARARARLPLLRLPLRLLPLRDRPRLLPLRLRLRPSRRPCNDAAEATAATAAEASCARCCLDCSEACWAVARLGDNCELREGLVCATSVWEATWVRLKAAT